MKINKVTVFKIKLPFLLNKVTVAIFNVNHRIRSPESNIRVKLDAILVNFVYKIEYQYYISVWY